MAFGIETFEKRPFLPNFCVTLKFQSSKYSMKSGENGIYLTVMAEGKPISETLMLKFSEK
jgi:hypothetical protein